MKKMISTLAVLMLALGVACANADRPIKAEELPAAAQTFIKTHFPNAKVSIAKIDEEFLGKDYEVMLTDGTKLEFNGSGEWRDVDCKYSVVPDASIPEQIREYVKASYSHLGLFKFYREYII